MLRLGLGLRFRGLRFKGVYIENWLGRLPLCAFFTKCALWSSRCLPQRIPFTGLSV